MAAKTKETPAGVTLEEAINRINTKFGALTLVRLGDQPDRHRVTVIPTQSQALNRALGVGGVPRGRITEIYGPEHGGKTLLIIA